MHDTAYAIGAAVLEIYLPATGIAVEIGAADVNGSLRSAAPATVRYIGMDLAPGRGVDVVTDRASKLPIRTGTVDLVIATSVFEHDEWFWEAFLEACRITKPGGHIYINTPSNGKVHRYPLDCWRFYPDAGIALERYSRRFDAPVSLVESFIARRRDDCWNDFVAIFHRDGVPKVDRPKLSPRFAYVHGEENRDGQEVLTEDMHLLQSLRDELINERRRTEEFERMALLYEAMWSSRSKTPGHVATIASRLVSSPYRQDAHLPADFNPVRYAALNKDLFDSAADPFEHYVHIGRVEGRRW